MALSGPNGILTNAVEAKQKTSEKTEEELKRIDNMEGIIEEYTDPEIKSMKLLITSGETGEVQLPIENNVENDYVINWGDGTTTKSNGNDDFSLDQNAKHTYSELNKDYVVTITGTVKRISTYYGEWGESEPARKVIKEVLQWGELGLEEISISYSETLTKIASPSTNSFSDLKQISFMETSLTEIPEDLFKNAPKLLGLDSTFKETNITNIPENLFINGENLLYFDSAFLGTKITEIPNNLFKNCDKATFTGTFSLCEELTNYLNLWDQDYYNTGKNEEVSETTGGKSCYGSCTKLLENEENVKNIPEYWRKALLQ